MNMDREEEMKVSFKEKINELVISLIMHSYTFFAYDIYYLHKFIS